MGIKEQEIFDRINQGEESAALVNNLFKVATFDVLDVNKTFYNESGQIGEIDGIWYFEKTIILIEATQQRRNLTSKMNHFFYKWSNDDNLNLIRKEYKKSKFNFKRIFFDLVHTSNEKIPSRKHISEVDNNYVFYKDDFDYFKYIYKIIGRHVKSEILSVLNFLFGDKGIKVNAIKAVLGNESVYLFSMPVDQLLKLCYVSRKRGRFGYQRRLNEDKIADIRKAIQIGDTITFPNSIIVMPVEPIDEIETTNKNIQPIYLPNYYCSLRVIDGQHRLLGFTKLSDELLGKFNLIVVCLDDDFEHQKEVRTFIKINTTQKKVNSSLLLNIRANLDYLPNNKFYDKKIAVLVARRLNEDKKSVLENEIYFGEADERSGDFSITLTTLVSSFHINKLVGKNNIFSFSRDDIDNYYQKINYIFSQFNIDNHISDLIFENRGIRLLCRVLRLYYSNFVKSKISVDLDDFINDMKRILTPKFLKELLEYYGIGGSYIAASTLIDKMKKDRKYSNIVSDLRHF